MADITVTAALVTALKNQGAITRPGTAGETLTLGQSVYELSSDGEWYKTDANTAASVEGRGIVVGVQGTIGDTTAGDGQAITICTHGPCAGFSSMTKGARAWVSETAGKITHTEPSGAGTWSFQLGWAETDQIFYVQPGGKPEPESNS